ncbi:MAG: hypothetical protein K1X89_14160, partial [Myxococcaceae bacterium]|nr:hypothetical protein [Myxococcaceae bacterium]
ALAQALRESLGGEAPWGPEQLAALARVPRRPLVAASGTQSLPAGPPAAAPPGDRPTVDLPPEQSRALSRESPATPEPERHRGGRALIAGIAVAGTLAGGALGMRTLWPEGAQPLPPPATVEVAPNAYAGDEAAAATPTPSDPSPEPQPTAEPAPKATVATKRTKPEPGLGWLTVDAKRSWGQVRINGKGIGPTPVYRHPLAPGRWKVDIDRPDGTHQSRSVTVKAGAEQVVMFDL